MVDIDPNAPTRVSATLKMKESKRYASDGPWIVVEGSNPEAVRQMVLQAVGMDPEDNKDLSLASVVSNARNITSGLSDAASGLGGTVISEGKDDAKPSKWDNPGTTAKEDEKKEDKPHWLIAKIEEQKSRPELKTLWAENKAEFDADESLMDVYRAKGKSLPKV